MDFVWTYKSFSLNVLSDATLHQVVPLSPHPMFLIGSISSVYLVSAEDGEVQHIFATEAMVPRSLQCESSDSRYCGSQTSVGFSNFTLGYASADTRECIVTNYSPGEEYEAIAASAPSGAAGGGWCTWEEAMETTKRVAEPGVWEIVKGRSVIGMRQEGSRNAMKQKAYRRRSSARDGVLRVPARWQIWTMATDGHPELDEVRQLFKEESDKGELLVVPGLGPKAKIGAKSVAFCLGNAIKVISAGAHDRYNGTGACEADSLLTKDSRRGRHGGSTRSRG